MNDLNQIVSILKKDFLKNAPLIENLLFEPCEIVFADENAVLFRQKKSGILFFSSQGESAANRAIEALIDVELITCMDEYSKNAVCEKFGLKNSKQCYQVVYEKAEEVNLCGVCDISKIDATAENVNFVYSHYTLGYSREEIENLIKNIGMYGAYLGGELVGFIGWHEERALGLLEIMPEYRNRGIAFDLEGYLINQTLLAGSIPYAHIFHENYKSLNLQKKLGFTIYDKFIYWCC